MRWIVRIRCGILECNRVCHVALICQCFLKIAVDPKCEGRTPGRERSGLVAMLSGGLRV